MTPLSLPNTCPTRKVSQIRRANYIEDGVNIDKWTLEDLKKAVTDFCEEQGVPCPHGDHQANDDAAEEGDHVVEEPKQVEDKHMHDVNVPKVKTRPTAPT